MSQEPKREIPMTGYSWRQRVDPADDRYVLIEMRIPNGGMPEAFYTDKEAADRLRRFCTTHMEGVMEAKLRGGD